ncbi:protein takeout-like [Pectinophora gossypiella]|uniref:protein takeout-like n=1 Tax=Pectinophora gossypiella TaxID=13191 RepID=UPI00214E3596|nr:protein takeout-like [Pectinophora gossypiella]
MKGLILLLCSYVAVDASLAPFITPCGPSDSSCMKSSAQKAVPIMAAGLPELGVKPLDPAVIDLVKADQAGLKLEFRKTTVKGLRNCNVLNVKRQGLKQSIELKCSATLVGEYTIGGKLLILPVEGDGKYKIKIRDIIVKVQYELKEKTAKGDKYWSLSTWKYTSDLQGGAEFQFQNLFNGNKQLSDTVHQFANTSWKEIFEEVAPPIVKAIVAKIIEEVAKFFDKVPIKDLALE